MTAKQKIAPLTSLRFLAAFIVMLYHTAPEKLRVNGILPWGNFINISFISVSFFFTLSGYILAVVYLQREQPLDKRRFWIARFARIYPLFVVALLMGLPDLFISRIGKYGLKAAILKTSVTMGGNLLMLQAWTGKLRGLNNPVWSLSTETVFYLLFPYLGWRLWKASSRTVVWGMLLFYLQGIVLVALALRFQHFFTPRLHSPFTDEAKFIPIFHVHEFFIGILLARWHMAKSATDVGRERLRAAAPWLAASALAIFIVAIYCFPYVHELYFRDGLLLPASVLAIVAFGSGHPLLDRPFSAAWFVALGEASYGLYLIHAPIGRYTELLGINKSLVFYPIYLAVCVGLSVVGFYFFEIPAREAILKWAHTRTKETKMVSSIAQ